MTYRAYGGRNNYGASAASDLPHGDPKGLTSSLAFLSSGGEMGERIRSLNWAGTLLGPPEHWSPALRFTVSLVLSNRFPLLLWWGPQYVSIYNDAYVPILGTKHPKALGQPVRDCWNEIWHILQPLIDSPFHGGPPTWMEDLMMEVNRHGYLEEGHWTVAYSPVPDETAPGGESVESWPRCMRSRKKSWLSDA